VGRTRGGERAAKVEGEYFHGADQDFSSRHLALKIIVCSIDYDCGVTKNSE
jgi:hypothetical protein